MRRRTHNSTGISSPQRTKWVYFLFLQENLKLSPQSVVKHINWICELLIGRFGKHATKAKFQGKTSLGSWCQVQVIHSRVMLAEHAADFSGAAVSPSVSSRGYNSLWYSQKSSLTHIVASFHFPAIPILTLRFCFESFLVRILTVSCVVQRNQQEP